VSLTPLKNGFTSDIATDETSSAALMRQVKHSKIAKASLTSVIATGKKFSSMSTTPAMHALPVSLTLVKHQTIEYLCEQ
jgi:hypothetical protein